jgi:hypothetical protein
MTPMRCCRFVIAAFLLCCTGCDVTNRPFRTSLPLYPGAQTNRPPGLDPIDAVTNAVLETSAAGPDVGYVEFDDQGWFWSHHQWQAVKDQIRSEAAAATNGLTIVCLVHGWEDNASYGCPLVQEFKNALGSLGTKMAPRKLFGVYFGWRGMSTSLPVIQDLTFYHRKDVAERIGHEGAITQAFSELEGMQDDFNRHTNSQEGYLSSAAETPRVELIIIGHSFGCQVIYSAISQILTERLVFAERTGPHPLRPVRSVGDLVILLNPAFEASQYNNLISLATSGDVHYPPAQPPVLAVFTSETDDATGLAFPAGRFFPSLAEAFRPRTGEKEQWLFNIEKNDAPDERAAFDKTIGHDADFINYRLVYANYGTNAFPTNIPPPEDALAANNAGSTNSQPYIFTNSLNGKNYACILQPQPIKNYPFQPRNPFFNVIVDKHIINGHGDITNAVLTQFLQDFILFSRARVSPGKPDQKKDTGN